MDVHILHVAGQRASRIQRVRDRTHPVISTGYCCPTLGRKVEADTLGNIGEEVLELCLPYLPLRERASNRAVCKGWKRVIDTLPRERFPAGKYWLYTTRASSRKKRPQLNYPSSAISRSRKRAAYDQENSLSMDLINLGRVEHAQLKDKADINVVVAQHLLGFISKEGALVFNPLATGPDRACSRFREGFPSQPTFVGLYLKPDGFVVVAGSVTSEDDKYYTIHNDESVVIKRLFPEELKSANRGPTGSATYFDGKLYWPTRFGEVVSLDDLSSWGHLGKPTCGEETLLWHQGLIVWKDSLYYLGFVQVGKRELNKIWKLNTGVWEEQEMLPSHPCDSGLPAESEGQVLEVVLVVPWLSGRQAEANHDDVGRLHAGVLAYNLSCNKWWWVSHCIHLWQGVGIVNRITPSVLNEFKPNQLLPVHRPSFVDRKYDTALVGNNVQLRKQTPRNGFKP